MRDPLGAPALALAAATALAGALTLAGCGDEGNRDTSRRRPIGEPPSSGLQRQLPEGHPEIGGMPSGGSESGERGPGGGMQRTRAELAPEVILHLDSGNAAYRAGDYESARRHYRAVVREDSTAAAGWFGVYMAERALGNEPAADSALERAGSLSDAPDMHPAPADTGGEDGDRGGSGRPGQG